MLTSSYLWRLLCYIGIFLISIIFALPTFLHSDAKIMDYLPDKKVNLGLDLRGGSALLLELELDAYKKDVLKNLYNEIKKEIRDIKVKSFYINPIESEMHIDLVDDAAKEKCIKMIQNAYSEVFQIKSENKSIVLQLSQDFFYKKKKELLAQSMEIIRRRVDEKGTKEIDLQIQGDDYILLQVPGMGDPSDLKKLLGRTAKLSFHNVNADGGNPSLNLFVDGSDVKLSVEANPIISGDMLVDAMVVINDSRPVVTFKLNSIGSRLFAEQTSKNIGKPIAIVLDGLIISAPIVSDAILTGSGQINGNFSIESANELALLLRSGALAVGIKIVEERTVGPSLGADSILQGVVAMIAGGASVFMLMFLVYYKFGLIANIALIMNIIMMIAALTVFDATLTLPGIAGIVLTIGMAVDANVLIIERIKEEMLNGKNFRSAINAGYQMAQSTIIDSNLTTVLAGLILYFFGVGPVKGFAVTLVVGILCSMFTSVSVTKAITDVVLKFDKNLKNSL